MPLYKPFRPSLIMYFHFVSIFQICIAQYTSCRFDMFTTSPSYGIYYIVYIWEDFSYFVSNALESWIRIFKIFFSLKFKYCVFF